jgi:hypothetical protein
VTGTLEDRAAELAALLPAAAALMAVPDDDGAGVSGRPGSRPPWNPSAANAALDAHEGIRRLEASLRLAVTGSTGPRRGGSDAATLAALDAVGALGEAVTTTAAAAAARILCRWSLAIQQLPAIDEAERPRRVSWECPYCRLPMMRLFPRAGLVVCLRGGFACADADGNPPKGHARQGRFGPQIEWEDGLVT